MTDQAPPDGEAAALLSRMITGYWVTQAIAVAATLGLADLLGDGPLPCDDLARRAGVHPDGLYRLLRALASLGIFAEVEPRRFALTPLAALLRAGAPGSQRARAIMYGHPFMVRPWERLGDGVQTGEVAFERTFGMPFFAYLGQHPDVAAIFNAGMTGLAAERATLAHAYDFSDCRTVVDVGGGHGALLTAVLAANPHLRGVLFDQPAVVAGAEDHLRAAGVLDRCQVVGGDFFEAVASGGDAYILALILHDWEDERAAAILRQCHRAMAPGGRVLVVERVVPPGDGPHPSKLLDLHMLVLLGGRERTEAEYGALLAAAGFAMRRVVPLPGGTWSVVEGVRAEDATPRERART